LVRAIASAAGFLAASMSIPRWLVTLITLLALITIFRLLQSLLRRPDTISDESKLDIRQYNEDVFPALPDIVWRWIVFSESSIGSLDAFCPRCDMKLTWYRSQTYAAAGEVRTLKCDNCEWRSQPLEGNDARIEKTVESLIDRKMRTGEWEAVVTRKRRQRSIEEQ
jgi:hypothetical protein